MGLLAPVILGALLIVAFALSAQQRLAIASHNAPMPARQIAYQMRVHHDAAIRLKQSDPALDTYVDALNDNDDQFLSCITGKSVATAMMTTHNFIPVLLTSPDEANSVTEELARQSLTSPGLQQTAANAWTTRADGAHLVPVVGIGILNFPNLRTASGLIPAPNCLFPDGAPTIVTQVIP